jgi:hypothetical protein
VVQSAGIVQEEEINIDNISGDESENTAEEQEVKTSEVIKEEILNNQEPQPDPVQKSRNNFIYEDPTRLK